jgi:hypothetical protein
LGQRLPDRLGKDLGKRLPIFEDGECKAICFITIRASVDVESATRIPEPDQKLDRSLTGKLTAATIVKVRALT